MPPSGRSAFLNEPGGLAMRLHLILVNVAAGMLAFLVSFTYLTLRGSEARPQPPHDTGAGRGAGDEHTTTAHDPGPQCETPSVGLALSTLARAAADRQSRSPSQPPTPEPLSDLTKLALRYDSVNIAERKAWNMALRRVSALCQDSLGDKQRLRLAYDVRLQGRKAAFDLRDTIVEEGAPLSPDLSRCIETVATRIDVDLEAGFSDPPPFEGSTEWSFLVAKRRHAPSEKPAGREIKPGSPAAAP
jgi:hypothetical protein